VNQIKLAIFDIDGTLRRVRNPWPLVHQHLGVSDAAQEFVEQWERGEVSYEEWIRRTVVLWRGFARTSFMTALNGNSLRQGARELVGWFTARSIPCVGISTGLTIFNNPTARELGLTQVISNEPHFEDGVCNGEISVHVREDNKGQVMDAVLERYAARPGQVVAFGDGTADIPLLTRAALGIAVCPSNDRVRDCAQHVQLEPIDGAIDIVKKNFAV
jgi:phosphoserine phosphatase